MSESVQSRCVYRFGVFRLDLRRGELWRSGRRVRLQDKPYQLLLVLLEHPGEIVAREAVRQRLWATDTFIEFGNGLNTAVTKLRAALGDSADNPRFVETIPRRGYRFIAPLTTEGEEETAEIPERRVIPQIPPAISAIMPSQQIKSWMRRAVFPGGLILIFLLILAGGGLYSFRHTAANARRAEAIREYQQGRELWRRRTPESLAGSIEHYNTAVGLDPSTALAYSGLADSYIVLPLLSSVPQDEAYAKARQAAFRALSLDASLAEAHTSAADVKLYVDWDFAGAEREFHRALNLNPNYATAHQWYAEYLSLMGRHEEAIREIQRALELEPLSAVMYHQAGQIYKNARQYDKAIAQYNRSLEIDPAFSPSSIQLGDVFQLENRYPEAIETEREFFKRHASSFYDPGGDASVGFERLAAGYATEGKKGFLSAALQQAQTNRGSRSWALAYEIACDYAQLGDVGNAMAWLNKAYEMHASDMLNLKVDPGLDPLRSDPGFQELVRRVGLP